ncbi:MAG: phosphoglycerate dehydrogenase [Bacteroidetes bacterium]|jgi:D-3-phosphoglycerate dehydrogenase|nr:phosphoglycerate dehydrogenase [Bacteroidota bacterium]
MSKKPTFIIDFDSTFTRVEALDILAEIVLEGDGKRGDVLQQIQSITDQGMEGSLDFRDSLEQRLALLHAHRSDVQELARRLKAQISRSFLRNQSHIVELRDTTYVVSNGFHDFIEPVVEHFGLKPRHVIANEFEYDAAGYVSGFNKDNPLSRSGGKSKVIQQLNFKGDVYVIGDGANDLEIRKAGFANKFYLFTENVEREKVKPEADHIAPNVDEILYELKMSRSLSYPKNRIKVLLLEGVHERAVELFEEEGYQVEYMTSSLSEDELCEKIKDVNIIGIRSKTQITERVIKSARRLINVGAFCIGTNQIDLEACTKYGVAVFNAPYSNTRSVVELAIAEIILLVRNLPDKERGMHGGKWQKSANGAQEVRGKKLGIIGYGNIGAQLSVLAEAVGLDVYYYDLEDKLALGNATKCDSLDEMLAKVDIVSLHVDGRPDNNNIFGAEQFAKMKDGAIFINLARGKVVDLEALRDAVQSGKLKGCAVDVYPKEPKSNDEPFESPLQGLPNTILTPHIGGSTAEAQENIGNFVPNKIIQYINTGSTNGSVNFPNVQLSAVKDAHRLLHIHHNVPKVLAQIDQILAKHEINILGQYLKTNEQIGYVITDVDQAYKEELLEELKQIEPTIWFRVLY